MNTQVHKPHAIVLAVRLLWVWLTFLALSGIYQAWLDLPEVMQTMPPELNISASTLFLLTAGGYVVVALAMIGVVMRAARGKNWARITLLISFIADLAITATSAHPRVSDYIVLAVDLGLQIGVLWLLFTGAGRAWFARKD